MSGVRAAAIFIGCCMTEYLETAVEAAKAAGLHLKQAFGGPLVVDEVAQHDIKLAIDVETQDLITEILLKRFPDHALYGEEGIAGNQASAWQWIVDPLDGTVNYFHGIPHFCVSIALREGSELRVGVIYDPVRDELWTATCDGPALLNGKPIQVSKRDHISAAIICAGFSKGTSTIDSGLPVLQRLVYQVRKCRMMGSAALDMAYVATGRLDAYIEQGISLWDIAAGMLLIERAGGKIELRAREDMKEKFAITASSGRINFDV